MKTLEEMKLKEKIEYRISYCGQKSVVVDDLQKLFEETLQEALAKMIPEPDMPSENSTQTWNDYYIQFQQNIKQFFGESDDPQKT